MAKTHEIKILEDFADAVYYREKCFEIRFNDRGYQKGDHVKFVVINIDDEVIEHPLSYVEYVITYVLNGFGLKDGYVVFGIREGG